jgi:hypothetical protein
MLIEYNPNLETPPREASLGVGALILKPGKKDYNPTLWNNALGNPALARQLRYRIDRRIIVILNEEAVTDSLREYTVAKAAEIISDTFDVPLLERWKENDTRKGILHDIDEQIALINAAGTGGEEDEED